MALLREAGTGACGVATGRWLPMAISERVDALERCCIVSQNAAVLGLHFLLEVAALLALAYWGWATHAGPERWAWAIGLPLLVAVVWATFRAPGDGSEPTVAIPGFLRLLIELLILGGGAAALYAAERPALAIGMAALVVVDYALSYDRVARLLGL